MDWPKQLVPDFVKPGMFLRREIKMAIIEIMESVTVIGRIGFE